MNEWKIVSLGEVAEFVRGINFKPDDVVPIHTSGAIACMRTKNVQTELDCTDVWAVNERFVKRIDQYLAAGDILVSSANSWNLVGKCCWIPDLPWRSTFGGFISVLRSQCETVEPRFLFRWFSSDRVQRTLRSFGQQTTNISNLNIDRCLKLSFPLPPLSEQRQIADMLDKAEALRGKRRLALAQLGTLTQAMFLDMFGDPVLNEKTWPTESMRDLMRIRRGGSPRPIEKFLGGDINWIKIGDGTRGSDIYLESCSDKITREGLKKTVFLKAGSLIFANCGVSLGFARILKIDGCIHDGWLSFDNIPENKLDKLFLLKALNSITEYFRRIAPSGTQPNLNTELIKNFNFILPPISLQHAFARQVNSIEKLKASYMASLAKMDELFASLQDRAFREEL